MIKLGDELILTPSGTGQNTEPHPCTVVAIHPQQRFFTVEFVYRFGKFRESFYFDEI